MTDVLLLSSPGCHLCEDAREALSDLASTFPIRVSEIDMTSPEGQELVREHRPATPPAVLVDGALFSAGRLPRRKLRRLLERAA